MTDGDIDETLNAAEGAFKHLKGVAGGLGPVEKLAFLTAQAVAAQGLLISAGSPAADKHLP